MEIKRIKLYVNNNEKSEIVANDLKIKLREYGFKIVKNNYDLAISIGGDGSFLRMVRDNNFNQDIYYIGINAGTLGFLQEIDLEKTLDFVKRLATSNFKIEELNVQNTRVVTNKDTYNYTSLNEIVIREKEFNTLKVPIYVDNEILEDYSGDGILVSTSTGSTAYNMSFGGSIIYNTLNTLSITPIAPLNNAKYQNLLNSVIIPGDKVVKFLPKQNIFLMVDGVNHEFDDVDFIETKIGENKIKCIRMNDFHFIKVINTKILKK